MTNSERRVSHMPKLGDPPGEALPDWQIIALFAQALGFAKAFPSPRLKKYSRSLPR